MRALVATSPYSEGLNVWRGREASPGFGLCARLPGNASGDRALHFPVTVAGPRRSCTGFRDPYPLEIRI